jgi:flagellar motility protein MotE (MotC chaperone)
MKKAQLILIVLAGLLSFASTFTVSWIIKKNKAAAAAVQQAKQTDSQQIGSEAQRDFFDAMSTTAAAANPDDAGLSERQLQQLIYDIRSKLKEHRDRQKAMDAEAERIEISRQSLQEDIDRLNELQNKLNLTLAEIRQKEAALKGSLTEIEAIEKDNFQRLASTYDKMDATQAGVIMTTMATSNQLQDSVKILYYMSERQAGKLLAEIAAKQPELASTICMQLKRVKEMN